MWNDLSMSEKSQVISTMVSDGIYNLKDIRNRYNESNIYKEGGDKSTGNTGFKNRFSRLLYNEAKRRGLKLSTTALQNMTAQLAWESGYGTSRIARQLHNYGGIGGYGNYRRFNSDEDFAKYYVGLMASRYSKALQATDVSGYARALKEKGYYEDSVGHYTQGLKAILGSKDRSFSINDKPSGNGRVPDTWDINNYNVNPNSKVTSPYSTETAPSKDYLNSYKGVEISPDLFKSPKMNTELSLSQDNSNPNNAFSPSTGPSFLSMNNASSMSPSSPVAPDYSYVQSLLKDFDVTLNNNIQGNYFDDGGDKRKPMPTHAASNPYKRRSWETEEEYKERVEDLDNKSQEAALQDSESVRRYEEWQAKINETKALNEKRSKEEAIEQTIDRAQRIENELQGLRSIPDKMSAQDTINTVNKGLPVAAAKQYTKNLNLWKPTLDAVDLGMNLYSVYNPSLPVLGIGMLVDGMQLGQSIVDEDSVGKDIISLGFDGIGIAGATNKLPKNLRIGGSNGTNYYIDVDKLADKSGAGWNLYDAAEDLEDLGRLGYRMYKDKPNGYYFSPFTKSSNYYGEGGDKHSQFPLDYRYERWKSQLPSNLRQEVDSYDLYGAYQAGLQPQIYKDGKYHLGSRDPRTGRILKKATHSTYGMAIRVDANMGYMPVYKNGETYTYPLPWVKD